MNNNGMVAEHHDPADLPLPSAINEARLNALASLAQGGDIQEVKREFYEIARTSIVASMRRFKTRLVYSQELTVEEARSAFQQILGATENAFAFTEDAYGQTQNSSSSLTRLLPQIPKEQPSAPKIAPPNTFKKCKAHPGQQVPRAIPLIVAGGYFVMPEFGPRLRHPRLDVPGNSGPAFVVYLGTNNSSGFFRHFHSTDTMLGAESIAPVTCPSRLVKSFPTVQAAKSTYRECVQTGVIHLLSQEVTKNTVYIVTKGFEPGVYTSEKNALICGLNWRGGEITCTEATVVQAKAIFKLWKSLGHVTNLRWDRKFVVDDITSEAV